MKIFKRKTEQKKAIANDKVKALEMIKTLEKMNCVTVDYYIVDNVIEKAHIIAKQEAYKNNDFLKVYDFLYSIGNINFFCCVELEMLINDLYVVIEDVK